MWKKSWKQTVTTLLSRTKRIKHHSFIVTVKPTFLSVLLSTDRQNNSVYRFSWKCLKQALSCHQNNSTLKHPDRLSQTSGRNITTCLFSFWTHNIYPYSCVNKTAQNITFLWSFLSSSLFLLCQERCAILTRMCLQEAWSHIAKKKCLCFLGPAF